MLASLPARLVAWRVWISLLSVLKSGTWISPSASHGCYSPSCKHLQSRGCWKTFSVPWHLLKMPQSLQSVFLPVSWHSSFTCECKCFCKLPFTSYTESVPKRQTKSIKVRDSAVNPWGVDTPLSSDRGCGKWLEDSGHGVAAPPSPHPASQESAQGPAPQKIAAPPWHHSHHSAPPSNRGSHSHNRHQRTPWHSAWHPTSSGHPELVNCMIG